MDKPGPVKGEKMNELTIIKDAALGIKDGKVAWYGTKEEATQVTTDETIDAKGKLVTPGLVDSHTHLVFGEIGRASCRERGWVALGGGGGRRQKRGRRKTQMEME